MPTRSIMSASTVRTIDDVMAELDINMPANASLRESQEYVRKITKNNQALAMEVFGELLSLHSLLSPITPNTSALIKLMERYGVALGGPQATSFFYPICEITSCPWDLYCESVHSDAFIDGFKSSSGSDLIEDITGPNGYRIAHFRKSVNGSKFPCSIRIICSSQLPLHMILNQKSSYEHTIITHAIAVFFWPKLQSRGLYRIFSGNSGLALFPRGKTVYEIELSVGKKATLRKAMIRPEIFHGIQEGRVDMATFDNTENLDKLKYKMHIDTMNVLVYAVHNTTVKLIGDTYGMK